MSSFRRLLGAPVSYPVGKYLDHFAIDVREDQTVEAVTEKGRELRASTSPGVGDAAETRFILEHHPERSFFDPGLVDFW